MYKIGSVWLGVLCAAGGVVAADGPKNQAIPDFATTEKTGWVLDHAFGVDDLLPPPTGGPGPRHFRQGPSLRAQRLRRATDLSRCRPFQSDPAALDHPFDEEDE